jgi:hypothetical protein
MKKKQHTNITEINAGNAVNCDICNRDYTDSDEKGGFIFSTYAYCPVCAMESLQRIIGYGEEKFITHWCPKDKTFREFVMDYRGGDGIIKIISTEEK